jgi:hypothetical protein
MNGNCAIAHRLLLMKGDSPTMVLAEILRANHFMSMREDRQFLPHLGTDIMSQIRNQKTLALLNLDVQQNQREPCNRKAIVVLKFD